jgi:DNA-binding LytR/AlgR family response regulator
MPPRALWDGDVGRAQAAHASSEGTSLSEAKVLQGVCVLLAEDEPLIALDAESTLQAMGVGKVVWVRTTADGLNALTGGRFDVAFLDLRLGQDSSIPLAQMLAAQGVPFGFLTGYQGDAVPAEFKAVPVVAKPFTPAQLADLLRSLLGQP